MAKFVRLQRGGFPALSLPGWHFHQFSMALGMPAPPQSRLPRDGCPLDRDYVTNRINCATVSARTPNIRWQSTLS